MLKRITAGLASLALVAGFGLSALPAAAQTALQDALCAVDEAGGATVVCGIQTNTPRIHEGDSLAVTVVGALDVTVGVALFAVTASGLERLSGPVEVTVQDEVAGSTVSLPVPVLDGDRTGGEGYVVMLADATGMSDDSFFQTVTIFSARPSIDGQPWGEGTDESPLSVPIVGGIPGDQFKVQASVGGAWVDFGTVDGDVVSSTGSTHLRVVFPVADLGEYPVRLYNVTRDTAGSEALVLSFGVEPAPEPEPTGEPTDEPTEEPTPAPTVPTETPPASATPTPSPTRSAPGVGLGAGGRPGLPSTGVLV